MLSCLCSLQESEKLLRIADFDVESIEGTLADQNALSPPKCITCEPGNLRCDKLILVVGEYNEKFANYVDIMLLQYCPAYM